MKHLSDAEIRAKVQELKSFYNRCFIHAVINLFSVLIWALLSGGAFWPVWVMFASAATLVIDAVRKDLFAFPSTDILPFLRKEWETNTFKRLKEEQGEIKVEQTKTVSVASTSSQTKTTTKKSPTPKVPPRKK